jgi:hypothetical protein
MGLTDYEAAEIIALMDSTSERSPANSKPGYPGIRPPKAEEEMLEGVQED